MKKSKILNILLTSVMLLSTVLTPQMSHALASMQADGAEETVEVEQTETQPEELEAEETVEVEQTETQPEELEAEEPADNEGGNSDEGNDSAEVTDFDGEAETGEPENDTQPAADEETEDDKQENPDNNGPPATHAANLNIAPMADLENIFEFDYFQKNKVDVVDGHEVDFDATYQVQYKWETDEAIQAGDTASLSLPDVFLHWENTPSQSIMVGNTAVGTYTVNNGELVFTFNKEIESQSVQNGFVGFELQFDREKFIEEWEQEIDFDGDGERDLTVKVTPTEVNTELDKKGRTDSPVNAKEIYWTVDIVNGADEPITNGTLADVIPDGLGEPHDFVVREVSYDIDGNEVVGEPITFDNPTLTDNGFEMIFDSIESRSGYRVEYTTAIEDIDIAQFTNDATFVSGDIDLEAEATVSGGKRSNPIQKEGERVWWSEDPGAGDQIKWTIIVNENGMTINDARVEDTLPDGLTIVPGSIDITLNNGETTDFDFDGFPIELEKVNANEKYTITFLTDVNWEDVNKGEYIKNYEFKNMATLFDGEEELNDDDAKVWFDRKPILEKEETGNIDYENRTISWEVTVNSAKHLLGDVTVTDQLPDGLSLEKIEIIGEDGETFPRASHTEEDGLLTIELPAVGTEIITIKYTTKIDDFSKADGFKNVAGMTGDGVGEGGGDIEVEIKPHANTYEKNFAGINYKDKTIDWRLNVNPIREDINEGFTITDTFTNDGLILLPETVKITLGEENLVVGDDYTIAPIGDGYQNGFTIEFHREIAKAELVVNFTTSYDEQFVGEDGKVLIPHSNEGEAGLYRNHAHFKGTTENDREINVGVDAEHQVIEEAWNSGYKEGNLVDSESWTDASDRKISWQVYFNYNQHNLGEDVSITDTLAYDGNIIEDTIKVSVYDVDEKGNTSITGEILTLGEDYTVVIDDEGILTVNFVNKVSKRYVIEFETTVQDISELNYLNNANLITKDGEHPYSSSVHYDNWDDFLDKVVLPDVREAYIGEELEWKITANKGLSRIKNATLTDTISAGLSFVEDSFTIETSSGEEIDYTLDPQINEVGETVLTITFADDLTQAITIKYKTIITAENGQAVNNKVDLNGTGIETIRSETEEIIAKQFSWVGGEFREDRGAIEISKVDSITGEVITASEATFELYRVVNDENVLMGEFTTENGILEVGNLFLGTYILKEIEAPDGYRLSEEEITIEVDKAYGTDKIVFEEKFNNISDAEIDIPVEKVWADEKDQDGVRPNEVKVELLANDKETDFENLILNADNNWRGAFTGLPVLDVNGESIEYSIVELDVTNDYDSTISGSVEDGFAVTNSREPELTKVSGEKNWDDSENQDGVRPEKITVNLLANGKKVNEQVITAEDNWNYVFEGLPKFEAGEEITYTVTENTVEGYTTNIDGYDITNSYTPDERSVTVTKAWDDANNQDGKRSESIEVQLYANDDEHGEPITLSDENDWTHTWTELAVNEPIGNEIEYTVKELNVHEEYEVDIDDENLGNIIITNSYSPEVTVVSGTKKWNDENNQDGSRPEEITINLLADGVVIDSKDVTKADDWNYTFDNLPVYKLNEVGQKVKYTVEEEAVDSYEVSYDGFDITNSYTPEVTDVSVTKEWNDEDDLAGFRPDHIEVELYADGEATGKILNIVADEDGVWEGSFINLPKYRDEGIQIDYTVQEVSLDEDLYSVEVVPSEEENDADVYDYTLINTHEVERIKLEGTKTWDDADNQDGVRPESITVRLQANGEEVDVIEVTAETEWAFEFTNLPKFADGEEINYTIQEDDVEDYSTEIDGMNITNSYTPGQTSINVVKSWDDVQDKDGIRPDSITVKLFANGKDTGQELVLSAKNNWQGDFTELDEYSDGKLIEYTIEEVAVEGYESTITGTSEDGFVITNTHVPEEPETPVDPEDPEKPEEETIGNTDPEDPADSDDDSDLPNAGEAATYTLLALVLVGLGFGLRYYGKRRTN